MTPDDREEGSPARALFCLPSEAPGGMKWSGDLAGTGQEETSS